MQTWPKLRAAAGFAALHATLVAVIWLAASLIYVAVRGPAAPGLIFTDCTD